MDLTPIDLCLLQTPSPSSSLLCPRLHSERPSFPQQPLESCKSEIHTVPNPRGSPLPTSRGFLLHPTCLNPARFTGPAPEPRICHRCLFLLSQNRRRAHYLTQKCNFNEEIDQIEFCPAVKIHRERVHLRFTVEVQVQGPAVSCSDKACHAGAIWWTGRERKQMKTKTSGESEAAGCIFQRCLNNASLLSGSSAG